MKSLLLRKGWLWLLLFAEPLLATPASTAIFCQKYPKSLGCENQQASCNICHITAPTLNPYGEDLAKNLTGNIDVVLLEALDKVENLDSDADGVKNIDEILNAGAPGDKTIKPESKANLTYDPVFAYKRLKGVYCGESATYEELEAVRKAADPKPLLHTELNRCLETPYWKDEALHRLADKKIQPLAAVGFGGNVVIADYRYDYRLFSYVMTGDRDARELLSAQYHIAADGTKVEGTIAREEPAQFGERIVIGGGQPLAPARRAGMMTTQWFLAFYTMFSDLPRNTASQVYRAYLGLDIAKGEGLLPVANEPQDVDARNVAQPDCAICHSTLDPLAYSFSSYVGIETVQALLFNTNGTFRANRTDYAGQGVILGTPVPDLLAWADKARNSDPFKKNIAHMMFTQALSREPMAHEKAEYDALWQGLPAENYSVNKMLHRFIDSLAFGGRQP
ncbi:hypothetical protein [Oligoflexus tunisiensis]|uniref:hypothetical protein n=1 Tax=Oligoflexus tunisiensis TaxID=708132 RepID=UPI00114D290F|nr:hypothetical protein [Oligoflexus tunisiensis]